MRISDLKIRNVLAALLILFFLFYIILPGFFFMDESRIPVLSTLIDMYLSLIEGICGVFNKLSGIEVSFDNHQVSYAGYVLSGLVPAIRFKKAIMAFLIIIWITKTFWQRKILFSTMLLMLHLLVNVIYLNYGMQLASIGNVETTLLIIPETLGFLSLFTVLFFWYRQYKCQINTSGLRVNSRLFDNELRLWLVACLFIIAYYLLYNLFDYYLWINFLFHVSSKILRVLGYSSIVEPFYLIGKNGSIFMLKSCLGFHTMLLFALFVTLMGNTRAKVRLIYILSGFLFLNLANIIRFIFLFIYIQNNSNYGLAMDVHDMFNYIIYGIVFILWIIWFEKFSF